jgi:hypothetical protein
LLLTVFFSKFKIPAGHHRSSPLLSVYGKNGGIAYDIGCAFSKTLDNSSLGPHARELNLRMMVGASHGHAHNRRCQIDWHPMYIEGTSGKRVSAIIAHNGS